MTRFLRRRYDISSRDNDRFKWVKSLWDSRSVRSEKACLLFGSKMIKELISSKKVQIVCECLRGDEVSYGEDCDVLQFSKELFDEIDQLGTGTTFLVVKTPEITEWKAQEAQGLEMICPFSDPHNLGATARSAVAFGARSVILTKESANPFLPRSIRASMGAVFMTKFQQGPYLKEICDQLQLAKATAAVLNMKGTPIGEFAWKEKMYLVAGEEGQGAPTTRLSNIMIPMQGTESLNASVAASLAMYTYRNHFPLKKAGG